MQRQLVTAHLSYHLQKHFVLPHTFTTKPTPRIQEADANGDAALISRINTAINAPLGGEQDDPMQQDDGPIGEAPASDALLRGALAT